MGKLQLNQEKNQSNFSVLWIRSDQFHVGRPGSGKEAKNRNKIQIKIKMKHLYFHYTLILLNIFHTFISSEITKKKILFGLIFYIKF